MSERSDVEDSGTGDTSEFTTVESDSEAAGAESSVDGDCSSLEDGVVFSSLVATTSSV